MTQTFYGPPVFLSYPYPHLKVQRLFADQLSQRLLSRRLVARTLGVTNYDNRAPLYAIRRLMVESHGLIGIAFDRTHHLHSIVNPGSDTPERPTRKALKTRSTSPWVHVEAAMAYQLGLPIMLLREAGVEADGVFGPNVLGLSTPVFDLSRDGGVAFLDSDEFGQVLESWLTLVNRVSENRAAPPRQYD